MFFAIVVIDIVMRSITKRADREDWNFGRIGSLFNWTKRFSMVGLVLNQKEFIIFSSLNRLFS
jgi:hypothetical protein